jgi:hypothetical protein
MEAFDIQDNMAVDNTYQDQSLTPPPPKPGVYSFKVEKWQWRRDANGNLVMRKDSNGNPTYPVLGLTTVSITYPTENARKVVLFQDLSSKPFKREGAYVSQTSDLLRALDASITTPNTGEALAQLVQQLNGSHAFTARADYEAYDSAFVKQEFERLGGKDGLSTDEQNKVYNSAKIRGASKILKSNAEKGKAELPAHRWVGPSGNVVDAKFVITTFIPSTTDVGELGVDPSFKK